MTNDLPLRSAEQLRSAINSAVRLDRSRGDAALDGLRLADDCHTVMLRYDDNGDLAGLVHSTAVPPALDAASVTRMMRLCRFSEILPDKEWQVEEGTMVFSVKRSSPA